jgi:hypothetical protein
MGDDPLAKVALFKRSPEGEHMENEEVEKLDTVEEIEAEKGYKEDMKSDKMDDKADDEEENLEMDDMSDDSTEETDTKLDDSVSKDKVTEPELEDIFHERCSKALASFWIQLLDIMSASHGYLSYPLLPAGKDLG